MAMLAVGFYEGPMLALSLIGAATLKACGQASGIKIVLMRPTQAPPQIHVSKQTQICVFNVYIYIFVYTYRYLLTYIYIHMHISIYIYMYLHVQRYKYT